MLVFLYRHESKFVNLKRSWLSMEAIPNNIDQVLYTCSFKCVIRVCSVGFRFNVELKFGFGS